MVKVTTEISRSRKIAGTADCLVMIEMTAVFGIKLVLALEEYFRCFFCQCNCSGTPGFIQSTRGVIYSTTCRMTQDISLIYNCDIWIVTALTPYMTP